MKRSRLISLAAALVGVALVPVGLFARSLSDGAPQPAEAPAAAAQGVTPPGLGWQETPAVGEDPDKKLTGDSDINTDAPPPVETAAPFARGPLLPLFSDEPPGPQKTRRPSPSEWKTAPLVRFTRMSDPRCRAKRVREWIEIRCDLWGDKGFSLIAGHREGIDYRIDDGSGEPSITIEFPVRRGDARVIQIVAQAGKYGMSPEVLISERWAEDEPAPTISLTSA